MKDIHGIVDDRGGYEKLAVDGSDGQTTRLAVGSFQEGSDPEADPAVGPETWTRLCHVADRGTDGPDVDEGCPVG